ncbi:MAG: glutathione binding-like protein [Pseudomonadota bacterium]
MKLYYSPGACSLASHIALIESGRDFEAIRVNLKDHTTETGEDFYGISQRGYVPVIDTADTGVLTENPAVLTYLADTLGAAPTGAARYKLIEWLSFIGSEIHGAFGPLFGGAEGAALTAAKAKAEGRFALTAELMGESDWLVGEGPSVADNYLFVTTLWAEKMGVAVPESIAAFRTRNLQRESVQKAMAAEGLG